MGTYRNGTYVAFDGQGEVNPVNSDLHNFELLKAWQANDNVRFNFVNSHEKTYSVRDSSSLETLKARLKERMANSKNMLVIVSSQTNKKTPYAITHTVSQNFYSLFQCFCSCLFISRTSVAKFKGLAKWLFIPAFFASMISSAKASAVIATIGTVLASVLAEARIFCVAS